MVVVQVQVAGGGRGNIDTETEGMDPGLPQRIERAVNGAVARRGGVVARNDIADVLEWLVKIFGADSTLGKILQGLANWLEDLDPDGTKPWTAASIIAALDGFSRSPQAQALALPGWIKAECFQQLVETVRSDVQEAGLNLANKIPGWLQSFMDCLLADDPESRALVAQVGSRLGVSIDVEKVGRCLFAAVMQYVATKDPWGAVGSFVSCMFKSNGGGGGGAQVEHESVSRC